MKFQYIVMLLWAAVCNAVVLSKMQVERPLNEFLRASVDDTRLAFDKLYEVIAQPEMMGSSDASENLVRSAIQMLTQSLVTYARSRAPCLSHIIWHIEDKGVILSRWNEENSIKFCASKPVVATLPEWMSGGHHAAFQYENCVVDQGEFTHIDFHGDGSYINWAMNGNFTRHSEATGNPGDPSGAIVDFHPSPLSTCARDTEHQLGLIPAPLLLIPNDGLSTLALKNVEEYNKKTTSALLPSITLAAAADPVVDPTYSDAPWPTEMLSAASLATPNLLAVVAVGLMCVMLR